MLMNSYVILSDNSVLDDWHCL